ncbi:MAG TPA: peptidylprolyl isomerase [Fimbriimonas sp.]|nr:peptidylprolyl isomerase [Fimbriimonas sp.]
MFLSTLSFVLANQPNFAPKQGRELEKPKFAAPAEGEEVVVISTKFGKMVVKLRPDKAPNHVANFKKLAKEKFYDKTIFHRVIPGFMIQGGDPNTKGTDVSRYGMGGPEKRIKAEFNNLDHLRGVVSMARSQDPDSAGSQFFVMTSNAPHLNFNYSAFGEVVKGIEVADKIVSSARNARDLPNERIEMTMTVEKWPLKEDSK